MIHSELPSLAVRILAQQRASIEKRMSCTSNPIDDDDDDDNYLLLLCMIWFSL
jgi:hypothetical protein